MNFVNLNHWSFEGMVEFLQTNGDWPCRCWASRQQLDSQQSFPWWKHPRCKWVCHWGNCSLSVPSFCNSNLKFPEKTVTYARMGGEGDRMEGIKTTVADFTVFTRVALGAWPADLWLSCMHESWIQTYKKDAECIQHKACAWAKFTINLLTDKNGSKVFDSLLESSKP